MIENEYYKDENDFEDFRDFEEYYGFESEEDEEPKELVFGEPIIRDDIEEHSFEDESNL